jgi:uncharacterized phage protein (TIGR02218 family)
MRTATAGFQTHIAQEVTTLARLWEVVRTDGTKYHFTDANNPIVWNGFTWRCDVSFTASAMLTSSSLANAQSVTVEVAMDNNGLKENDLRARLFDDATGEIFFIDYENTSLGAVSMFKGTFGRIQITDKHRCTIEIKPAGANNKEIGFETYSQTCRASLFDTRCGLLKTSFRTSITITAVSGGLIVATALTQAANYFAFGFVEWLTGNNVGQQSPVQGSDPVTTSATLNAKPLNAIQVGDTAYIYPGCNKYVEVCRDKFANVGRFRGEPRVPRANNVNLKVFNASGKFLGA